MDKIDIINLCIIILISGIAGLLAYLLNRRKQKELASPARMIEISHDVILFRDEIFMDAPEYREIYIEQMKKRMMDELYSKGMVEVAEQTIHGRRKMRFSMRVVNPVKN